MDYAYTTVEYAIPNPQLWNSINGEWPEGLGLLKLSVVCEETELIDYIDNKITVNAK